MGATFTVGAWRYGAGAGALEVGEAALDLTAGLRLFGGTSLALRAPVIQRRLQQFGVESARATSIGDIELYLAQPLVESQSGATRLGLIAGLGVPTAPAIRDDKGALLPAEVQPGTGAFVVGAGLVGEQDLGAVTLIASVLGRVPAEGRYDWQAGASFSSDLGARWRALSWLEAGARAGIQWDGSALEDGQHSHDSGGLLVTIKPSVTFRAGSRVDINVFARIPVIRALNGEQRAYTFGGLGLSWHRGFAKRRPAPPAPAGPVIVYAR